MTDKPREKEKRGKIRKLNVCFSVNISLFISLFFLIALFCPPPFDSLL